MKDQIKELRIKIDGLGQLSESLKPLKSEKCLDATYSVVDERRPDVNSRETQKAVDSLYLAKAWLGKMLGEIGTESPYANDGKRKSIKDIEPAADIAKSEIDTTEGKRWYNHSDIVLQDWFDQGKSHIEKVDWLREEVGKIAKDIKVLDFGLSQHRTARPGREFAISRTNTYNYLCEARFWLGFELQRIRETSKN